MTWIEALDAGLRLVLVWHNFLFLALGVVVGVAFAAVPGLSGILAVTLLLPFTFYMTPVAAVALLMGAYKGTMFGGSISAITFGVPGDAPAAATKFDGFELTKQRKPYRALTTALYSSISANLVADLVTILTFLPLAAVALAFGPREIFALLFAAMAVLVIFTQSGVLKGIIGTMVGFLLATIGLDRIAAYPRMTFGIVELEAGIGLIPCIVGLFAFTELMLHFSRGFVEAQKSAVAESEGLELIRHRSPDDRLSIKEWLGFWRENLIGYASGVILGILPGPGATMSAFTSYAFGSRLAKNKGKYGTGVAEGVASAESGNSATVGPTLIPLFAFGIPGSGTAGLFMAAFMLQGITPGPGLYRDYPDVMFAVFIIMLVGTVFNLVISKGLIPIFARLGLVNPRILVPALIPMVIVGVYAVSYRWADVVLVVLIGLLGIALRRFRIPIASTVVAFMIGSLFEMHLRRGLIIADSWTYWFSSPIAVGLYVAAIVGATLLLRQRHS